MAISKRTRFEILRRDDHRCRYCGATAPDVKLTIDHVIPVALGGSDDPTNLVTACAVCNSGKGSIALDSPILANIADDAIRWAKAMQFAAQKDRQRREAREHDIGLIGDIWDDWKYTNDAGERVPVPKDADWRVSIARFFDAGLAWDDLNALIPIAMHSQANIDNVWRYFCGCAWRLVTDRQDAAKALIESGEV